MFFWESMKRSCLEWSGYNNVRLVRYSGGGVWHRGETWGSGVRTWWELLVGVLEVVVDHIRKRPHLAFFEALEIRIEVILHINR